MFDIICVTNRLLCRESFPARLEKIAGAQPEAIILREKDLPVAEYTALARQALAICGQYQTQCILHSHGATAQELGADSLHLPLPLLRTLSPDERQGISTLGASCHSVEEAQEAQELGCTYITAGHIFPTDCKRGLPGRGLDFLAQVCRSVTIPVYAIGGISPENIGTVMRAGAKGACLMSGFMTCPDPAAYLRACKENLS